MSYDLSPLINEEASQSATDNSAWQNALTSFNTRGGKVNNTLPYSTYYTQLQNLVGTDITDILQNLINTIGGVSTASQIAIRIPPGDFYISKTLSLPYNGGNNQGRLCLSGSGMGITRLRWTNDLGSNSNPDSYDYGKPYYAVNVMRHDVTTVTGLTPVAIAVSSDGTKTYVVNSGDNTVSVINTATNAVSTNIGVGTSPSAIAITGTKAYVTNSGDNTVTVINTGSDTVVTGGSYPIAVGVKPSAVAITTDGTKAYVANSSDGTISVIAVSSDTVSTTVGVGTSPSAIAITGTKAYVTNSGDNTVTVINTGSDTVVTGGSYPIAVGSKPADIAITPDGTKAFVANSGASNISVITLSTNTVTTVSVGASPTGVAVTPVAVNGAYYAYVANYNANTVSVINTGNNTVISTVYVGSNPVAALVAGTKAYIVNSKSPIVLSSGGNSTSGNVAAIDTKTNIIVSDGYSYGVGGGVWHIFEDISLIGPGLTLSGPYNSSPSTGQVGSMPATMYGFHAFDGFRFNRVEASGFYAGLVIDGNHQYLADCKLTGNYYGLYFVLNLTMGDQSFVRCDFSYNRFAGIAFQANASGNGGNELLSCLIGNQPYGLFFEETVNVQPNSSTTDYYVDLFYGCDFTNLGNAAIWDQELSGYTGSSFTEQSAEITGCSFVGGAMSYSGTYTISELPVGPMVKMGYPTDNTFTNSFTPGDLWAYQFVGNFYRLGLDFISGITSGAIPHALIGLATGPVFNQIRCGDQELAMLYPKTSVTTHQLLEDSFQEWGATSYGCIPAQGSNCLVGVAIVTPPSGANCVYVATKGQTTVLCDGTVTKGCWLKASTVTPGTVTKATSLADGVIAGFAETAASGGTCTMTLRISV